MKTFLTLIKFFFAKHTHVKTLCFLPEKKAKNFLASSLFFGFKRLNAQKIEEYLSTNEWKDKAGAYAIQGYAEKFIKRINGSYSNVVGLPLFETYNLLNSQGLI